MSIILLAIESHVSTWHSNAKNIILGGEVRVDIVLQLKAAGLKITGPRVKIFNLLAQTPIRHWSVEALYQALCAQGEEISLATVYRVLTQFEKVDLVNRHRFESGYAVFELAELNHHDHLVCTQCGNVEEFVDSIIEDRQQMVAQKAKYILTGHALNLYGVCASCQ